MSIAPKWLPGSLAVSLFFLVFMTSACGLPVPLDTPAKGQPSSQPDTFTATFIGQDGGGYAGKLCSSGTVNDNVHIHLDGLRTESEPISYRVEDYKGGGLWATPCDPVSNWFLSVEPIVNYETNLYFKPFRDAPSGTEYKITVTYQDGVTQIGLVHGSRVKP